MIAAAEASGVNMMYVGSHRFYSHNVKTKELIDRGEVGEVVWITRDYNSWGVPGDTRWARWKSNGGGFFMHSGSILVDQIRCLAGSDIEEVYSVGMGRYVAGGDGEDTEMATFKFKNGVSASLVGSSAHPGVTVSRWRLGGTEGIIEFDDRSGLRLGRGDWQDVPYPYDSAPKPEGFSNVPHAIGYGGGGQGGVRGVSGQHPRGEAAGGHRLRRSGLHRGGHRGRQVPGDRSARPTPAVTVGSQGSLT